MPLNAVFYGPEGLDRETSMNPALKSKSPWRPGMTAAMESASPSAPYAVVFEDDGATGYAYAIDRSADSSRSASISAMAKALGDRTYKVVDALYVYSAESLSPKPLIAEIRWSVDGMKAALFLGKDLHAGFDFAAKRGVCRTGLPSPGTGAEHWNAPHDWDSSVLREFE